MSVLAASQASAAQVYIAITEKLQTLSSRVPAAQHGWQISYHEHKIALLERGGDVPAIALTAFAIHERDLLLITNTRPIFFSLDRLY